MSDQPATLNEAILALQAQLPRIGKGSTGQVGTRVYKYADLPAIMDAIRDLMIKFSLIWVCKPAARRYAREIGGHIDPSTTRSIKDAVL